MCRHLGYLGSPRSLNSFIQAPHGLRQQGLAPREMVVAAENPDGWGIAWWTSPRLPPRHYRTIEPIWTDDAFAHGDDRSPAILAAARRASPGTTRRAVNNAPFVADTRLGSIAFSLNGHAFHGGTEARVRAEVPPSVELAGDTDSEVLFAILCAHVAAGADLATALAAVHAVVNPAAEAYVNLMAMSASVLAATTWRHTLYLHTDPAGTTLASEALDENPAWQRVPDAHLVTVDHGGVHLIPVEGPR